MRRGPVASVTVLVLVLAALTMPTAAAEDTTDQLYEYSLDVIETLECTDITSWLSPGCLPSLWDGFVDGSADTVQNDIYTKATFTNDGRDRVTTEIDSHLNQSFGIGMAKAKLVIVKELNNGSSLSEAKQAAIDEVDDVYSAQQQRLISYSNTEALKWEEAINRIQNTDGLRYSDVMVPPPDNKGCTDAGTVKNPSFPTENITLFNGTNVTQRLHFVQWHDTSVDCYYTFSYIQPEFNGYKDYDEILTLKNTSGGQRDMLEHDQLRASYHHDLKSQHQQAVDNVQVLADEIYNNYQDGGLAPADVLGPLETLKTASTDYEDTGYYSYVAVSLMQQGLASNTSYAFEVEWNNTGVPVRTATGQLFVERGAYNNTLRVNTTYNVSDNAVWFAHEVADGSATKTQFNNTFTILEMTDTSSGKTINSTGIQSTEFHTTSTANLSAQLDAIAERQEALLSSISVGGGLLDGSFWADVFPNVPNPFAGVADTLGLSETETAVLSGVGLLLLIAFL